MAENVTVQLFSPTPVGVRFTTRQGDRIESNLKYLVKRENKSEGDA